MQTMFAEQLEQTPLRHRSSLAHCESPVHAGSASHWPVAALQRSEGEQPALWHPSS